MTLIIQLFLTFFKIGFIGFGGGLAILPLVYQGISAFSPITQEEFANLVGISQATPGPIAVNAATYVGFLTAGIPGSLASTIGVAIPSFILVSLTVKFIDKYKESRLVQGGFLGIRPAAMGMIASAFIFVGESAAFPGGIGAGSFDLAACLMAAATFALAAKTKLGPIPIILIMGACGTALTVFETL